MLEFLGKSPTRRATAVYLVGADGRSGFTEPTPIDSLPRLLDSGLDVERSLWDRELLLFDIDIEYQNFDRPTLAWKDPGRVFRLQEPILTAALDFLRDRLIDPLVLVSGRGYHLVWAISRGSRAFRRLAKLGYVPPTLATRYAAVRSPRGERVDLELGRAFAGQGQVAEYLGHRIRGAAMERSVLPIQLTALEVGTGAAGREIVSLDLSEYGDPIHTRHIRLPFSLYLKPREPRWQLEESELQRLLPIVEIPVGTLTGSEASALARCPARVAALAASATVKIPVFSRQMDRVITEYEDSRLGQWHRNSSCRIADAPAGTSRDGGTQRAPPCLDWLFARANDWLLKPAALQHAVRILTSLNWPPSAIARRIYESYRSDCSWGRTWISMDPAYRAEFYTRLFAGMIHTGADSLIDLNCVSHQEKGYCHVPACRSNLVDFRDLLQRRRTA